jgi:4-amino-4-deoxy-L-arabinose transferase-like glycosyltransferase
MTSAHAPDPADARAPSLALLLLGLLLAQGLAFIGESSQTSDEAAHLLAGYTYLKTGRFGAYPGEPPLMKELAAAPLLLVDLNLPIAPEGAKPAVFKLGREFLHENRVSSDTILLLARLPMLGLSLLLGWSIFVWGRRLFGSRGGLLALALYALDPNVVAHSSLVMTDLGATLFMFLAVFAFWCWTERPGARPIVLAGLATGAALASKYTALWLLPMGGLVAIAAAAGSDRPPGRIGRLLRAALVVSIVATAVVALSYAVVGLPAYFDGLAIGLRHTATGNTSYLMGRTSKDGWWYYFLVAYAVKTPIGTLLLLGLAIGATIAGARRVSWKNEAFLWLPVLTIVVVTCIWKVNIGLRHFLPVYPFLCLTAGRLASPAGASRLRARPVAAWIAACVAWNGVEAASIAPYDLAYFNELAGGPRNGHLWLLDSNLDWGQASKALRRYMASENLPAIYCSFFTNSDPYYYGVAYQYVPGIGNPDAAIERPFRVPEGLPRETLAVSAMSLHFVRLGDGTLYDWLKDRPVVARPGYAYAVYDITGDAEAHAHLAVLYLTNELPAQALGEAQRALRLQPANRLAQAVLVRLGYGR